MHEGSDVNMEKLLLHNHNGFGFLLLFLYTHLLICGPSRGAGSRNPGWIEAAVKLIRPRWYLCMYMRNERELGGYKHNGVKLWWAPRSNT